MIKLNDIVVKFGDFTALHDINVHVKEGEFFTFLGPSGCGKTTTLRTITGFIQPVSGSVVVKDQDITHVPIEDRNIGIVFQSYALFPTMTVYDNIAFGLKIKKMKKPEIDKKVREIARKVDLSDEQLAHFSISRDGSGRYSIIDPSEEVLMDAGKNAGEKVYFSDLSAKGFEAYADMNPDRWGNPLWLVSANNTVNLKDLSDAQLEQLGVSASGDVLTFNGKVCFRYYVAELEDYFDTESRSLSIDLLNN